MNQSTSVTKQSTFHHQEYNISTQQSSPEVCQVTQTSATSWLQNLRALTDILRVPLQNRTSIQHYRHHHRKSATGAAVFRGLRLLQTASPASDILRTTIQEHSLATSSSPGLAASRGATSATCTASPTGTGIRKSIAAFRHHPARELIATITEVSRWC